MKMRMGIWKILLILVGMASICCQAVSAFVPVFIDARTEARLGPFPYDRAILAKALTAFEMLGAKVVVMKFFLDQPKGAGDDALASAMAALPVVLQARCDDTEANSNLLAGRFSVPDDKQFKYAINCNVGWIPLPPLQQKAADICFIDQPPPDVLPLRERHQGCEVKSLYRCAMSLAGKTMAMPVTESSRKIDQSKMQRFDVISLVDVLDGKIDRAKIAGKVVVFGYDGPKTAVFDTPLGKQSAHRVFMMNLLAIE